MILFFLFSFALYSHQIQTRIVYTPIHSYLPFVKMHHFIVFSNPSVERSIYIVDFSPINKTVKPLLLGKTIPGEVRIRYLNNATIYDDYKKIVEAVEINASLEKSRQLTNDVYHETRDVKVKQIMSKIKTWDETRMNMYKRNCQHFGRFVLEKIRENTLPPHSPLSP